MQQTPRVNELKDKFTAKSNELKRATNLVTTQEEVEQFLADDGEYGGTHGRKAAAPVAGFLAGASKSSPLARRITAGLSGSTRGLGSGDGLTARRFDADGYDTPANTPLTQRTGKASVSLTGVARATRPDGNQTLLLSEPTIQIARLLQPAKITNGKYEYIRQNGTSGTTAAEFVPPLTRKPSTRFLFERVEDRARVVAVLSDPISKTDLEDIKGLADDVGGWLAWQITRAVDAAIITGNSETNPEEPDGILETPGVLNQPFLGSALTTVRHALTRLETAGILPTAIALDPQGWEDIELAIDENGRPLFAGQYQTAVARTLFGTRSS